MAGETNTKTLDFKGDMMALFRRCFPMSEDERRPYEDDWSDAYMLYDGMIDLTGLDPALVHPELRIAFSDVEVMSAGDVKTMLSTRPLFPLEPTISAWKSNTEAIETMVDFYADGDGELFRKLSIGFKLNRLLGNVFVEPYWTYEKRRRKTVKPQTFKGFVIPGQEEWEEYVHEELNWRIHAPWMIGRDPNVSEMQDMRWTYVGMLMSRSELREMMKFGKFDKKFEDLKDPKAMPADNLGQRILSELRNQTITGDDDMGMLHVMFVPRERRFAWIWNGQDVIREGIMPYEFVPIAKFTNTDDPIPHSFWGRGEIKDTAPLIMLINQAYGNLMNANNQSLNPMLMYPVNCGFDERSLINSPGRRVGYNKNEMDTVRQGVFPISMPGLGKDAYEIPERLRRFHDEAKGSNAMTLGQFPERKELAFVANKVAQGADARAEVKVKLAELGGMKQLGMMSVRVMEANITPEIVQRILGPKAKDYVFKNPNEIPGGAQFRFKGSDSISEKQAKFDRLNVLFQMGAQVANQAEFYKLILEQYSDLSEDEVNRVTTVPQAPMLPGQPGQGGATQPMQPGNTPTQQIQPPTTGQMAGMV